MEHSLANIKYLVFDMDGTIYLGNKIIDGVKDFFDYILKKGLKYCFFTNNSSKSPDEYYNKLTKFGLEVYKEDIISSSLITIDYLKKNYSNLSVYLVGTPSLEEEFRNAKINLVETRPDIVCIGFDTTLNYDKLVKACKFVSEGSIFIATNPDINCPTEDGFIPDCGSICALIEKSTGRQPIYMGKPYVYTHNYILNRYNANSNQIAYIGDRLYTDIAIANNFGAYSILVLSGETKITDVEKSQFKPDIICDSVKDLIGMF